MPAYLASHDETLGVADAAWPWILGALGLAVVLAGWWWSRRKPAAPPAPPALPKFRVVTLGLQGSGKTLLLTSMYRRLQVPGGRGFHLHAPYDQLIELNRWYQQVASTADDWPSGTRRGEMREFEFKVMAPTHEGIEPVFTLGYLEYPGELLTDPDAPGSTAQARLLESIANADALIGIIDGLRVLQAYQGDQRGSLILQASLDAMINAMLGVRTPIAFVITKWDLLDEIHPDENVRLETVRTLLMGIHGFRDLVMMHSARRVVRLLPVSAVGHDFAVLQGNEVHKRPHGHFQPDRVELPLCAVVPDVLRQVELTIDRTTREQLLGLAAKQSAVSPAVALEVLARFVAQRAGRALISAAGGGLLAELAVFPQPRAGDAHALSAADRRAEDLVQARRTVVSQLQHEVAVLEARLPRCRLGGD